MNDRVNHLQNQMVALEAELRTAVHDQESRMFSQFKGKRVEFERSVRETHRKLKTNFFRWLVTNRPQNLITGPLIYGNVKVRRSDYLVFDRHITSATSTSSRSSTAPIAG
jgi:hypothetical protein